MGRSRIGTLLARLARGEVVFGSLQGQNRSPVPLAETAAADFIFYDMETGSFDLASLQAFIERLEAGQGPAAELPVLVRIPPIGDGREVARERVSDVCRRGASGVIFPHVESGDEALYAVRSVGDLEGDLASAVLIEDRAGVAEVEKIVRTPGVTMALAGPADLRRAFGGDAEAVERAIQKILASCREAGVPCGITAGTGDVEKRIREGFRILITAGEALAIGRRAAG